MIRAVFWDMDDTLLNFKKSEAYAIRKAMRQAGIEPTEESVALYAAINDRCWKQLELGEITRAQLYVERFRRLFQALGIEADPTAISEAYPRALGETAFFIPGSFELFRDLKAHYREYIVTNGNAYTSRNRLRISGFEALADHAFVSEEMGVSKPSPAFFDRCFEQIPDLRREETVIVGDSLSSDMKGGRGAGLYCVWYNPEGKPCETPELFDAEIRSLHELPALLAALQ